MTTMPGRERSLQWALQLVLVLLLLLGITASVRFFATEAILLSVLFILFYLLIEPVNRLSYWLSQLFNRVKWLNPKQAVIRALSTGVILILTFAVLVLSVLTVVPPLQQQIERASHSVPKVLRQVKHWSQQTLSPSRETVAVQPFHFYSQWSLPTATMLPPNVIAQQPFGSSLPAWWPKQLPHQIKPLIKQKAVLLSPKPEPAKEAPSSLPPWLSWAQMFSQSLLDNVLDIGSNTLRTTLYALSGLVILTYLLIDSPRMAEALPTLLPAQKRRAWLSGLLLVHVYMARFVRGRLLLSFISAAVLLSLFALLGSPSAGLLAAWYAVSSLIPTAGTWVGLLPSLLLLPANPLGPLGLSLLLVGFVVFRAYVLVPRLIRHRLRLHPLVNLVLILICVEALGLQGILLYFPLSAAVTAWFKTYRRHQKALSKVG